MLLALSAACRSEQPSLGVGCLVAGVEHPSLEVEHLSLEVEHPSLEVEHPSLEVEHPSLEVECPVAAVDYPLLLFPPVEWYVVFIKYSVL